MRNVLFASPEAAPFAHSGGLGEVAGALPKALCEDESLGIDCRVILPLYGKIDWQFRNKMRYIGYTYVNLSWRRQYLGLFSMDLGKVRYYFIDNEYYFKRDGFYGYYDDCERFAYFSMAVFTALDLIKADDGFVPDIIHANDWQTALIPVYQTTIFRRPFLKTILTIHNIEYQGHYGNDTLDYTIGIPEGASYLLDFEGDVNLLKGGIECANAVTTVSPTYAAELTDWRNAFGLHDIIGRNSWKTQGIINGIDTDVYDPAADKYIPANFDKDDLSGKSACKKALQEELCLPVRDDVCMLSLCSRLVPAKGVDLLTAELEDILDKKDVQFIMLGTGTYEYEEFFKYINRRFPDKARCMIEFNTAMSHKLYAASDIFIMPSRSEPCGLSQMISSRYGTVPLVHKTGGLSDSVKSCAAFLKQSSPKPPKEGTQEALGFVFEKFSPQAFRNCVLKAINAFERKAEWERLMKYDMQVDFSWKNPAKKYADLYKFFN